MASRYGAAGIYTAFGGNRQRIYVFQSRQRLNGWIAMNFLDEVPAVRRIDTDRDDLLAVELVGHIRAADVENLFGLFEAAWALHPSIDALVRLVDHEGVDWTDIAPATVTQGRAEAARHIRRCALVGEPDWTSRALSWLAPPLPIEIRHFPSRNEAEAWAWLGAHEKPADV